MRDAIEYVSEHGRNELGTPIFYAAGNDDRHLNRVVYDVNEDGTYVFEWRYEKDSSGSAGDDAGYLACLIYPDGSIETFEELPNGWISGGDGEWEYTSNPVFEYGISAMVARSGSGLGDDQSSYIRSKPITALGGDKVEFYVGVSSKSGDYLRTYVSNDDGGSWSQIHSICGLPYPTYVDNPARLDCTIAVGASTDCDYRAYYSQYGGALDFVAPSSGGFAKITTTDRTGDDGYNAEGTNNDPSYPDPLEHTDYTSVFTGTSAATPLAAGIAGLILSKNPTLTGEEVREIMRASCDKIGGEAYDGNGFNVYYGYGRVNAAAALAMVEPHVVACIVNDDPDAQYSRGKLASISFQLSGDVNDAFQTGDLTLERYDEDTQQYVSISLSGASIDDFDSETDTQRWDLSTCGITDDGWYRATLTSESISEGEYVSIAGDLFVQGGDTDADQDCDLDDLFAVRNHFGANGSPLSGDTDLDEDVDLDDLFAVRNNFGAALGNPPESRGGGEQAMGGGGEQAQPEQLTGLASGEDVEPLDSTYATLTLSAEVTAAYDPDTWELITPTPDYTTLVGETYWWQIDFSFEIADIPDGFQGFGGMSFDIDVSAFDDAGAWSPDTSTWSPQFPPGVQNPIWSDNGDYGAGGADFEGIVVAIDGVSGDPNDPRGGLGQGESRYVGSIYVLWDGLSQADLTVTARQMGLIDDEGVLVVDEAGTFLTGGVTFGGGS